MTVEHCEHAQAAHVPVDEFALVAIAIQKDHLAAAVQLSVAPAATGLFTSIRAEFGPAAVRLALTAELADVAPAVGRLNRLDCRFQLAFRQTSFARRHTQRPVSTEQRSASSRFAHAISAAGPAPLFCVHCAAMAPGAQLHTHALSRTILILTLVAISGHFQTLACGLTHAGRRLRDGGWADSAVASLLPFRG